MAKNKKILLIAPRFHNLEMKIYKKLEQLGYEVDYFDERPSNTFFIKVFLRLKLKKIINYKINRYYKNILSEISKKEYDYILIINLEAITESILKEIRKNTKKSKMILYMWDSLELKNISDSMLNIFDKTFTFDPRDAEQRNMNFLNLFYSDEYNNLKKSNDIRYDLCFIGTIHGDRYKILTEIRKQAEALNLSIFYYLYMPSRIMFFARKIFDKSFKNITYKEVKFVSLDSNKIANIITQSRVMIDISYRNQRGLSMRTFETIGMRKKLLTTHEEVKKNKFYNPNNIKIFDKTLIKIDKEFILGEYKELDKAIYEKYSIDNWLKSMLKKSS